MAIRYIVNEEKRTVVAVIDDCAGDAWNVIKKMTKNGVFAYTPFITSKYDIENTFVGVAKCNPEDAWDVSVGKELARKRVICKHDKAVREALMEFHKEIVNLMIDNMERIEKLA